jgi:hypothetical protein
MDWFDRLQDLQNILGVNAEPMRTWDTAGITAANVADEHLSQRWWSHRIHKQRFKILEAASSLRDRGRLSLQRMPHTTAWMTVTPNVGQGRKMDGRDYRYLVKWWLGHKLVEGDHYMCPLCEEPMDPFGDHLVSCKQNLPIARHNALRDALADALKARGFTCAKEVAIGGARRPADLALPNLDRRGPLAIDLVVHHPLAPSATRTTVLDRKSLKQAEKDKIDKNEELCHGCGWLFAPMGWHTWGGVGPHGAALLARLEDEIAGDLQGWPKINTIATFRRELTFSLMGYVAKQLRGADEAIAVPQALPEAPPFQPGPVFSTTELRVWEDDTDEPLFLGPIRIRGNSVHKPHIIPDPRAPGPPPRACKSSLDPTGPSHGS